MYFANAPGKVRRSWSLGRFWSNCASTTSGTTIAFSALALTLLSAFLIGATQPASAQTETVLYSFTGTTDGGYPQAGLIRDAQGNLYGTTTGGGNCPFCGVVFQLSPAGSEKVLYGFTSEFEGLPVAGLVRDGKVNLYGTTPGGSEAGGTVFEVTAAGTEKVLHTFTGLPDGAYPQAGLIRFGGKLYGTTQFGGANGAGTVFEVTGKGKEKVLYSFRGYPHDGSEPLAGLVRDSLGNLYGTTFQGGTFGFGTVFEVTATGTEKVLYSFIGGADGGWPSGGLVRDAQGNLYGTTGGGGAYGAGTVFEVTAAGTEKVLYSFTGGADGAQPVYGGLVLDGKGNLYGTTPSGGVCTYKGLGCGVVFKVTPDGKEKVLHTFAGPPDGSTPYGRMIRYKGDLYGTTLFGGVGERGVVFKVTP